MRKLKLVNAASYTGPRVGGAYLNKGDTHTFEKDEDAEACLEIMAFDRRGIEVPIFEDVTEEAAKPAKVVRRSRPSAAPAAA